MYIRIKTGLLPRRWGCNGNGGATHDRLRKGLPRGLPCRQDPGSLAALLHNTVNKSCSLAGSSKGSLAGLVCKGALLSEKEPCSVVQCGAMWCRVVPCVGAPFWKRKFVRETSKQNLYRNGTFAKEALDQGLVCKKVLQPKALPKWHFSYDSPTKRHFCKRDGCKENLGSLRIVAAPSQNSFEWMYGSFESI